MLPTDWTVEEVRAQIAKQKPKVDAMSPLKQVNESTKIIDELRRCMPNGKLPNVGTTKREELEHVVFDMFYKYHDGLKLDAVAHNASFNDSDDSVSCRSSIFIQLTLNFAVLQRSRAELCL